MTKFDLFEITDLGLVRIVTKIEITWIMYTTEDKKGHIKVRLTLTFKVNCQGQVIDYLFFEIHDLDKVRIDTEILSTIYTTTEGHVIYIFVTSVLKVNPLRPSNFSVFLRSQTSEMSK